MLGHERGLAHPGRPFQAKQPTYSAEMISAQTMEHLAFAMTSHQEGGARQVRFRVVTHDAATESTLPGGVLWTASAVTPTRASATRVETPSFL